MARKKKKQKRELLNVHQKKAFKKGEFRLRPEDIPYYLKLADSDDPQDRLEAAANLCPCHVRHPVPEIQQALYRLMEDPDQKVRDRAWHTLEDGGIPNDSQMDAILERALEANDRVLGYVPEYVKAARHKERTRLKIVTRSEYDQTGKCDFCSESNVKVKTDFDTEIPDRGQMRFALVCETCNQTGV